MQTFFVDNLDPGDAVGAAKRARKISSHATFFKAGQCLGRTLVCVVKSGSVSSTIKTLEPVDQPRGKKQPAIRKFLQGSNDSLRVFKVRRISFVVPFKRDHDLMTAPGPIGILYSDRIEFSPFLEIETLRRMYQGVRNC